MAISRIAGQMLQTNLERDGVNLSFSNLDLGNSTPVLYLDVANNRVGINRGSADVTLDLVGNFRANGTIQSYAITAAGNVIPSANVTYDLGQPSFRWNNIYANLITANIASPGGNGEIVFNDGGVLGASPGLTFNKTSNSFSVSGNVAGANINTAGLITATGNVTGGNLITGGLITATGNVTGGNLVTSGVATVTGNVIGGNIETAGEVAATGNVTGGNLITSGVATVTGNITGGNIDTAGQISATGNITGGNLITSGSISTTGNLTGGNLLTSGVISATGNITGGNIDTAGTATANNLIAYTLTSTGELGLYSGSSGNIIIDPNGTGMVQIVGTNGFVIPTGNTAQRPSPADTGTLRYNTEYDRLEVYDGTEWDSVVSDVTNQIIVPDGSSLNYTLDREATAPSVLVSINGLVQIPGMTYAYTVTGNVITFAEAPLTTDIIDIRFL